MSSGMRPRKAFFLLLLKKKGKVINSMSTYVMSDIHGCFDDMNKMLDLVEFTETDSLIIAGDYIDRGRHNFEMLNWIVNRPDNVILLKGNHEEEFSYGIGLMAELCKKNSWDMASLEDTKAAFIIIKQASGGVFDYYGTIQELIDINGCTLIKLLEYGSFVEELPLFHILEVNNKPHVIVHAGYISSLDGVDTERKYAELDEFYLYARDDAYIYGGIEHGVVIAGHTPTILEEELPFNYGNVYKSYDEELDCTFYDIDCGCSARGINEWAKLACIRLEDEAIFYI